MTVEAGRQMPSNSQGTKYRPRLLHPSPFLAGDHSRRVECSAIEIAVSPMLARTSSLATAADQPSRLPPPGRHRTSGSAEGRPLSDRPRYFAMKSYPTNFFGGPRSRGMRRPVAWSRDWLKGRQRLETKTADCRTG